MIAAKVLKWVDWCQMREIFNTLNTAKITRRKAIQLFFETLNCCSRKEVVHAIHIKTVFM